MFSNKTGLQSAQRARAESSTDIREIHVRIIVHARGGMDCLPLVLARLSAEARQCEDAEKAWYLMSARNQLAAAARAYNGMEMLSCTDQIALVQHLPEACEGLAACFVCADTAGQRALGAARSFLAPTAFAAGGVISELVANAVSCGNCDDGGTVCARIDRDRSGERLILADAKQCEAVAMTRHFIQALSAWAHRLAALPIRRRGKPRTPILAPIG